MRGNNARITFGTARVMQLVRGRSWTPNIHLYDGRMRGNTGMGQGCYGRDEVVPEKSARNVNVNEVRQRIDDEA